MIPVIRWCNSTLEKGEHSIKVVKFCLALTLILIAGLVIYFTIYIIDSFNIPPVSIIHPESYLNIFTLLVFNICVFTIFILYPIIRGIRWCFKKGQSSKPTKQPGSETDKNEKSISSNIISIFLSGTSILLGTYPIFLIAFMSIKDITDYLSEIDFIIMAVYLIILPLSGIIISVISIIWKKWWLPRITLLYCCVEFINAVIFMAVILLQPIETLIG